MDDSGYIDVESVSSLTVSVGQSPRLQKIKKGGMYEQANQVYFLEAGTFASMSPLLFRIIKLKV